MWIRLQIFIVYGPMQYININQIYIYIYVYIYVYTHIQSSLHTAQTEDVPSIFICKYISKISQTIWIRKTITSISPGGPLPNWNQIHPVESNTYKGASGYGRRLRYDFQSTVRSIVLSIVLFALRVVHPILIWLMRHVPPPYYAECICTARLRR